MMMIRTTTLAEVQERGGELVEMAMLETGSRGPVNWRALEMMADVGCLIVCVVEVDGQLVGYGCAGVSEEFWEAGVVSCTMLSLYVQWRHRGRWGEALRRAVAAEGRRMGATLFRCYARSGSRYAKLLSLRGMTETAVTFEASLTREDDAL